MLREVSYDTIFQAQEDFRQILDSLANPGKIHRLQVDIHSVELLLPSSALIGLALMNADVTFCIPESSPKANQYFILNTAARPTLVPEADFLFLSGLSSQVSEYIAEASEGELEYPEKGAFLIIETGGISEKPTSASLALTLRGPGVDGERTVYLRGLKANLMETLAQKNQEYPLGADTLFTDPEGYILGLPRSNKFSFTLIN